MREATCHRQRGANKDYPADSGLARVARTNEQAATGSRRAYLPGVRMSGSTDKGVSARRLCSPDAPFLATPVCDALCRKWDRHPNSCALAWPQRRRDVGIENIWAPAPRTLAKHGGEGDVRHRGSRDPRMNGCLVAQRQVVRDEF